MMCIFVENWNCNFAGQEITLDICKTCIKARRLYNETKQDEALQKRKQMMDKEVKKKKPKRERDIETEKERSKRKRTTESPEIEKKNSIDALEEEAFADRAKEEGLIESIEEGSSKDEVKDKSSTETLEPASIIEMKNLEGSIEDIQDDPTQPTDTWLETTGEGEVSLLKADFPNPPDKLKAGEDKQKFLVRVRRTEDEFFIPRFPEVNVKICEDGEVVTETGRIEIEDVHGELILLTWDAGKLLDLYGTDVEIVLEGFGAGEEGTQNRIEIGALGWRANLVESKSKERDSEEQTLEEKAVSPLTEESSDETIDAIQSDINPLE